MWFLLSTTFVRNRLVFSFSRWGETSPLGRSATVGLLYQPRMIDDDDYGAVG
jgi:hypothetical protein